MSDSKSIKIKGNNLYNGFHDLRYSRAILNMSGIGFRNFSPSPLRLEGDIEENITSKMDSET